MGDFSAPMHQACYTSDKFGTDGDLQIIQLCNKSAQGGSLHFSPHAFSYLYIFDEFYDDGDLKMIHLYDVGVYSSPLASTCPTFFQTALHILMF